MIKQLTVTYKTASATITYAEMGDIVINSSSDITITLPPSVTGLWFRVSSVGSGIVSISDGSVILNTLNANTQALYLANSSAGWWVSTGAQGEPGPKGDKGDPGEPGPQGETGPKGDKGDKGDTGLQGPKGDAGAQGEQGIQGPKGDKGDAGDTGPQGIQGPKGDTGEQGPEGAQGIQGPKGDTGDIGPKGDKGDTGDVGPQGPKGDIGETGPQGETGIQGPKGDTGETGPQGIQGIQGVAGADGKSAYQTAAENGYSGTETAFNEALAVVTESVEKDFKVLSSAPTSATVGVLGQRAMLSATGDTYICTAASSGTYTWEKLAKNSETMGKAIYDTTNKAQDVFAYADTAAAAAQAAAESTAQTLVSTRQKQHTATTVTLTVAGWVNNIQSATISGLKANDTVIIAPEPDSQDDYCSAKVKCTTQMSGALLFGCSKTPSSALTVNIAILEV